MSNQLWDMLHNVFRSKEDSLEKVPKSLPQEELREISVDEIEVNPHQPRKQFNSEELQELAGSIQSVGLIHPPIVRIKEGNKGYELVAGERRLRAAKLAGLKKIPVLICSTTDQRSAQAALVENLQRVDLNAIEIAQALRKMITDFGLSQDEVAQQVSKKRSTVANYLRLLTLPQSIQNSVSGGAISMGHAKVILSLEDKEQQQQLHDRIIAGNLTVREAEQEVLKRFQKPSKKKPKESDERDIHVEHLAEEMQRKLGTKVTIQDRGGSGSIIIDYYTLDDLDRLVQSLQLPVNAMD